MELVLDGIGDVDGGQVVGGRPGSASERAVPGGDVATVLGQLRNDEMAWGGDIVAVEMNDDESGLDLVVRTGVAAGRSPPWPRALADAQARAGAHRRDTVHLRIEHAPYRRVLVRAEDVPGFGWSAWSPATASSPGVRVADHTLANGLVTVTVDPADGTFSLDGLSGLDLLVDDGDAGDTYNYSPPELDVAVDSPTAVTLHVEEFGPLRATDARRAHVRLARTARRRAGAGRSALGRRRHPTWSCGPASGWCGSPPPSTTPAATTGCGPGSRCPAAATSTRAECAFAVVRARHRGRGRARASAACPRSRPGASSRPAASPSLHDGLHEYELVDDGKALALTLMRSVGVLSGTHLIYRPHPAGPPLPVVGAQMKGANAVRYALAVGDDDPYALADDAFLPLAVVTGTGGGVRPASGSVLRITGAQVSAVRRSRRRRARGAGLQPDGRHRHRRLRRPLRLARRPARPAPEPLRRGLRPEAVGHRHRAPGLSAAFLLARFRQRAGQIASRIRG